jgi:hypothetical protein
MNGSMEGYDEVDAVESFDDFESTEATYPFRPGRKVSVPGGVLTATFLPSRGGPPGKLQMPALMATDKQLQTVVQALNANTQRLNAFHTQLDRVRKVAVRPPDPQGQATMSLFLLMQLRKDLEEHTHGGDGAKPTFPTASGGGFSSFLPILLLQPGLFGQSQPGLFGQSSGGSSSSGTQGTMSLLSMFVLMQLIRP